VRSDIVVPIVVEIVVDIVVFGHPRTRFGSIGFSTMISTTISTTIATRMGPRRCSTFTAGTTKCGPSVDDRPLNVER